MRPVDSADIEPGFHAFRVYGFSATPEAMLHFIKCPAVLQWFKAHGAQIAILDSARSHPLLPVLLEQSFEPRIFYKLLVVKSWSVGHVLTGVFQRCSMKKHVEPH